MYKYFVTAACNKKRQPWKSVSKPRRGFTIRLKRLKPRAPDFGGPQNFGSKENFQYFCKQLYLYFCFGSTHVFVLCRQQKISGRMSAKDWSEWRWAFAFYGVENWLLLRIMCGTKRLNSFFRLCNASEVLHKYVMWMWSDNFTAAFFVSFTVTVFVADIEGSQSKVICLWIGTTTCSVNVTSTCSQWRN